MPYTNGVWENTLNLRSEKVKLSGINLKWFKDARFGMFIHYGLYSQLGKGEWVQLRDTIPLDEFSGLKNNFTASGFDADFIVQLAKKAARYISPGSSKLPSGKYNLED